MQRTRFLCFYLAVTVVSHDDLYLLLGEKIGVCQIWDFWK